MREFYFQPEDVCSTQIRIELEGPIIENVTFEGGCDGNLQAIGRLVSGMEIHDALQRLRGIRCGAKDTSCPDQLAKALEACLSQR